MSLKKYIGDGKKSSLNRFTGWKARKIILLIKWCDYAEHNILPESEAGFNLTVFYGKDADWAQM